MPAIDRKAFLARIASSRPTSDAAPADVAAPPGDSAPLSCGEQLLNALGITGVDPGPVDDALREAVTQYSGG